MSLYDELNSRDDLEKRLIAAEEHESDFVEYKTIPPGQMKPSDKDEAAKDISAFANSSGGILIYGIATADKENPTKPTGVEPIEAKHVAYLLLHAESPIRAPILGIQHKTIRVSDTHSVLLYDVPQSPLAPHQVVTRNIYYRRQGPQSVGMAHDLVELYFGRRLHAKVEPRIKCEQISDVPTNEGFIQYRATLSLLNVGGQIARDTLTRFIELHNRSVAYKPDGYFLDNRRVATEDSTEGRAHSWEHFALFYPRVSRRFFDFTFSTHMHTVGREKPVFYLDVYAADVRPYRYSIFRPGVNDDQEPCLQWEDAGLPALAP